MSQLKFLVLNIIETLLRAIPFPCKTGLIKIGNPGRNSPVLLTCNYHLTVERVKRALKDMDAYLLVANSRGINVWCAATGGLFTNHDVISVLKTSGIEGLVEHRDVILPQLAATGVEAKVIREKTRWEVIWGPVYANDIPTFIENNFTKNSQMREVKFPWVQRVEMAVMWAFPFSIIASIVMFFTWREALVHSIVLIWGLPFLIFLSFPLYSNWLNPKREGMGFSRYTVIFDFGRVPLILWGVFMLSLIMYSLLCGNISGRVILRYSLLSFIIVLIVSFDLMGSTPVYKSGLHEDRFLKVVLDEERCKGVGLCEQVCPRNCYDVDKDKHIAVMPREDRCVQCGACIVQCPFDALYFESPKGEVIPPETIRRFKLNVLGKRLAEVAR